MDARGARRLLVDSLDVIQVEVWATLFPAASIAPETVWYNVSSPNPAMWEATKPYGAPMNITFLNATSYQVPAPNTVLWRHASAADVFMARRRECHMGVPTPYTVAQIAARVMTHGLCHQCPRDDTWLMC